MKIKSLLHKRNFDNTRVFLRADLNVPLSDTTILNDYRLQALLPTIDLLLQKGAKIILGTHIGRPKERQADLSTEILVPWFQKHGYKIEFEPSIDKAHKKSLENPDTIVLLENLRFFPGEKKHDPEFVGSLERLADFYVNDAFGVAHQPDSSVTDLPRLFSPDRRTGGLLFEQEIDMLSKLIDSPARPFVLIVGGAKIKTKLPLLHPLIKKVDTILLCPAIVFTFLKALGKPVGKSLVDDSLIHESEKIMHDAQKNGTEIVFPVDYQIADHNFEGPLSLTNSSDIPADAVGISIGPNTAKLFIEKILKAKTILFNGAIGDLRRPETLDGMKALMTAMADSPAFTVIAGGTSVAAAQLFGLNLDMDYCSTGGGAVLAYVAGKKLPGFELLI